MWYRQLVRINWRRKGANRLAIVLVLWSLAASTFAQTGKLLSEDTMKGFSKSHQSKVFFHEGKWWALAYSEAHENWGIWEFSNSFWSYNASAGNSSRSARPDAVLNADGRKLFVLFSKSEDSEFYRFSYNGDTWSTDAGFPVVLNMLGENDSKNPLSLARAKSGELWAFRISEGVLQAIRSTNNGASWSARIIVKSGLNSNHGSTDARAFTAGGKNYIGVAYAEDEKPGASRFGFLTHRDDEAPANWQDESAALQPMGTEDATANLCLVADNANNLYLLTQNHGGGAAHPRNTLYKRTAAGTWKSFKVNTSATWTSPALAVKGKNKLYLMGINTATNFGEYKVVSIGQESKALTASVKNLFKQTGEGFWDLSAPLNPVDTTSQLLVCSENNVAGKIWYNYIKIGGTGGTIAPSGCNPPAAEGPSAVSGTKGGSSVFYKPNQSKVFFYDNTWWLAAADNATGGWFLWKKSGASWIKTNTLSTSSSVRPDCFVDSTNSKLYILLSHSSSTGPKFLRMTYDKSAAAWALDAGFPVALNGFTHKGENPAVLVRAKNGEIWIFVVRDAVLYTRRSQDDGLNWSNDVALKAMNTHTVMVDAVSFTASGVNYIGVGYGEDTDKSSRYGFLKHKEGEAVSAWSDETNKVILPPNTFADDHLAMAVSTSNDVYMVVKTNPDNNSAPGVVLYKRKPGGVWSMHNVFIGSAETRPALAIDATNKELYVFTTSLGTPRYGRYRKYALGKEDSLITSNAINFLKVASDDFHNVSTPPHHVNACSGLLIAAENNTQLNTWYQLFSLNGGGTPPAIPPVAVANVIVNPSTAKENASYKIPVTIGAAYGLEGGKGTITITWPIGTIIPTAIDKAEVNVNGIASPAVTTAAANRRVSVTVPKNFSGGATLNVLFKKGAGILNPSTPGSYKLKARTSLQPTEVNSPAYAITEENTITPVIVGNIIVTPDTTQRTASYSIPITLGANGALTAGSGTITVTWPNDTQLPATIAKSPVKINGTGAFAVSVKQAARQAVVTVPSDLANNASFTLLFNANAGIINPSPGDYTLQVQTSAQNLDATSPNYNIKSLPVPKFGARFASATRGVTDKSSQSKVFFFENKWWAMGLDDTEAKWFLWYFNGAAWVREALVDTRPGVRADVIVDENAKRLFVLGSQTTNSTLHRFAYLAGKWNKEAETQLVDFGHGNGGFVITMARAANGALWVFRINNSALEAQVSEDDGKTWSSTLTLKTGLAGNRGQTEAVTFNAGGSNYVGVFYSLVNTGNGAPLGFMKHLDTAADNNWTDESNKLSLFGSETPDGSLCANVTNSGIVYVMTRNTVSAPDDPNNSLYKRNTNGTWSKFVVNIGYDWRSPTLAIDASGNRLIIMGIRASAPNVGEFVTCDFGQENSIIHAFATIFMKNGSNSFGDLSAPLTPVTNASGLMMLASNTTTDDLWYSRIDLNLAKAAEGEQMRGQQQSAAEIDHFSEASVYPNPFNPSTAIRFAVKEPAQVKLQIFNLRGELVRTLANGEFQRGFYEKQWNGRDSAGNLSASGVYFYRLQIGARLYRGRMQMVK